MTRSLSKGPQIDFKLYRKVMKARDQNDLRPIKTWARSCEVIPDFVGVVFEVHNGNKFIKVSVTEDMIGHKLGEFSPTRQFRGHAGSK
jgi:small subunit ribosomal protein S19